MERGKLGVSLFFGEHFSSELIYASGHDEKLLWTRDANPLMLRLPLFSWNDQHAKLPWLLLHEFAQLP